MQVSVMGLDIAKNTFHAVGQDGNGREVVRKKLRRGQVRGFFAQTPVSVVVMEACAGSHHWGREIEALGHRVRLLPTRQTKPYMTDAKNDFNDAASLCDANRSGRIHEVAVKSVQQQDWQTLSRVREAAVAERTAHANRVRGLLAEYGEVVGQGLGRLRRRLPELLEDAENGLSALARELFAELYEELCHLDERVRGYDRRLQAVVREHEQPARLSEVRGLGPVLSVELPGRYGDARQFARARDLPAAVGLAPGQYSSGDKTRLRGISKRGDPHIRSLFIHGARSVLANAERDDDALSRFARRLKQRRPFNVAVVAVANKLARIAWVVLARGERYEPMRA